MRLLFDLFGCAIFHFHQPRGEFFQLAVFPDRKTFNIIKIAKIDMHITVRIVHIVRIRSVFGRFDRRGYSGVNCTIGCVPGATFDFAVTFFRSFGFLLLQDVGGNNRGLAVYP